MNGIGVGVFRVHPLIMTLGMGFVVLGVANVWQLQMVRTRFGRADRAALTSASNDVFDIIPDSLLVFIPVARS